MAKLRLVGAAKLFYIRCPEIHAADVTWDNLKDAIYQTFRDAHSEQFHFMERQTTEQRMGQILRELADRCRAVANKVMCKVEDPADQRIHRENVDHMMLVSFVHGLSGFWGTKCVIKPHEILDRLFPSLWQYMRPRRSSRVYSKPRRTTNTQAAGHL